MYARFWLSAGEVTLCGVHDLQGVIALTSLTSARTNHAQMQGMGLCISHHELSVS
jgi:hypothetical protein